MLTWVCLVLFAIVPSSLSCRCNRETSSSGGQCKTEYKGRRWCYVDPGQGCQDERRGTSSNRLWSYQACENSSDDNGNTGPEDLNDSDLGCPANGRYPDTEIFCLNEDGSSNCQQRSDCPDPNDTCDRSLQVCTKADPGCVKVGEQQCFDREDGSSSCWAFMEKNCFDNEDGSRSCSVFECSVFIGQPLKSISGTTGQTYSGSQSIGSISSRCPSTTPCPYRAGCGRLVGLGRGGRLPACPRRRWTGK